MTGRASCTRPCSPAAVTALYGAFAALARARAARGALELDLREDRVVLDAERRPVAVEPGGPARQPPADRGVHDPRQCRRGRGARSPAPALHVPGPRRARPGKARGPARVPRRARHPRPRPRQGPGAQARAVQPVAAPGRGEPRGGAGQRAGAALPGAGRLQPRTISAISGWRCAATRISPRRSAAMPICWSIAR